MANGEQVNGSPLNALPEPQALDARLNVPLPVIGPPVNPVPLPTLVTVPAPVPGKVCPVANVIWPLLARLRPVSAGELVPE